MSKIFRPEAVQAASERLPGHVYLSAPVNVTAYALLLTVSLVAALVFANFSSVTSKESFRGYVFHGTLGNTISGDLIIPPDVKAYIVIPSLRRGDLEVGRSVSIVVTDPSISHSETLHGQIFHIPNEPLIARDPRDPSHIANDFYYQALIKFDDNSMRRFERRFKNEAISIDVLLYGETKTILHWAVDALKGNSIGPHE